MRVAVPCLAIARDDHDALYRLAADRVDVLRHDEAGDRSDRRRSWARTPSRMNKRDNDPVMTASTTVSDFDRGTTTRQRTDDHDDLVGMW